MVKDLVRD